MPSVKIKKVKWRGRKESTKGEFLIRKLHLTLEASLKGVAN